MTGGLLSGGSVNSVSATSPETFWGLPGVGWAALAAIGTIVIPLLITFVPPMIKATRKRFWLQPEKRIAFEVKRIEAQWLREASLPGRFFQEFKIALFYTDKSEQTIYITELNIFLDNKPKAFENVNATVVAGD